MHTFIGATEIVAIWFAIGLTLSMLLGSSAGDGSTRIKR